MWHYSKENAGRRCIQHNSTHDDKFYYDKIFYDGKE
jgi:hypothetical protein